MESTLTYTFKDALEIYQTIENKVEKVSFLFEVLKELCNLYYSSGTSPFTDEEYDTLEALLKELEPNNPFFTQPRSTWIIGERFAKAPHFIPMASLDKVHTLEEVIAFAAKMGVEEFLVQDKADGMSISIQYENGQLKQAITRGDGAIGEDITRNVLLMKNVPKTVDPRVTVLRGEIVLTKKDFKYLNELEDAEKIYKNTRNAGTGIAKRLDGKGCEHLTVLMFDAEIEYFCAHTKAQVLDDLHDFGIDTVMSKVIPVAQLEKFYAEYGDSRGTLEYDIDGLVLKVNSPDHQWLNPGGNPLDQKAWKFANQKAITVLEGITWQLKFGKRLSPVALVTPVNIGGITINRATLNNLEWMDENNVQIGATILLERANDVIPKVLQVMIPGTKGVMFPDICPECGEAVVKEGKFVICPNENCPAKAIGILYKWVDILGIKDISLKRIRAMYDAGLLITPADYYTLTVDQLVGIDKMGAKVSEKILKQFNKQIPLAKFVAGLGMEDISLKTVENLISAGINTLDKFLSLNVETVEKIPGFGNIMATAVFDGICSRVDVIEKLLLDAGVEVIDDIPIKASDVLVGKSFCLTGTLSKPREDVEEIIKANGGTIKGVSGKLDYLVVGPGGGGKQSKAEALGIKILSEDDLMKMIGDNK